MYNNLDNDSYGYKGEMFNYYKSIQIQKEDIYHAINKQFYNHTTSVGIMDFF